MNEFLQNILGWTIIISVVLLLFFLFDGDPDLYDLIQQRTKEYFSK